METTCAIKTEPVWADDLAADDCSPCDAEDSHDVSLGNLVTCEILPELKSEASLSVAEGDKIEDAVLKSGPDNMVFIKVEQEFEDSDTGPSDHDLEEESENYNLPARETVPVKSLGYEDTSSTAEDRPFSCVVCTKSFSDKSNLKRHVMTHTKERPHPCEQCDKTFIRKSHLDAHMRTHDGERPFPCHLCHKTFTQLCIQKRHILTHSKQKPFKCEHCTKSFTRKAALEAHARLHLGIEPFACQSCPKTFNQETNLKRHLLLHANYRPFTCASCGKTFAQSSNLKRHILTHAKMENAS